jgi:hypothetical protein
MSFLMPVPCCFCYCGSCRVVWIQVLWWLQHYFFCSGLLWLFSVFCILAWIIMYFLFLWIIIKILMESALNLYIAFGSMVILTWGWGCGGKKELLFTVVENVN